MTTRVHEGGSPEEPQVTAEFIAFLERASLARPRGPGGEVRRFNQGRATGCVDAEFTVPALPDPLRVGLFATPATYRSVIRFANAASASDRERDTRGMAIGVLDAAPANLTPGQTRHDFILNSHPVMPAATAKEFLALLQ